MAWDASCWWVIEGSWYGEITILPTPTIRDRWLGCTQIRRSCWWKTLNVKSLSMFLQVPLMLYAKLINLALTIFLIIKGLLEKNIAKPALRRLISVIWWLFFAFSMSKQYAFLISVSKQYAFLCFLGIRFYDITVIPSFYFLNPFL